ncbi:MAG: hypothetical protein ACXAC7_01745 [Candidatus Hodarchaeales archaeon]
MDKRINRIFIEKKTEKVLEEVVVEFASLFALLKDLIPADIRIKFSKQFTLSQKNAIGSLNPLIQSRMQDMKNQLMGSNNESE